MKSKLFPGLKPSNKHFNDWFVDFESRLDEQGNPKKLPVPYKETIFTRLKRAFSRQDKNIKIQQPSNTDNTVEVSTNNPKTWTLSPEKKAEIINNPPQKIQAQVNPNNEKGKHHLNIDNRS